MRLQQLASDAITKPPSRHAGEREIWQRNDAEEWFLSRGMPTMTRTSKRFRAVLLRASPVIFGLTVISLLTSAIDTVLLMITSDDAAFTEDILPDWYVIVLLATVVTGILAGLGLNRYIRRATLTIRQVGAITTIVPLAFFLTAVPDTLLGTGINPWVDTIGNAVTVVFIVLLTRLGMGSILVWSLRQAMAQLMALAALAARAIPMILLVTLFAFLSDGMWLITSSLSRRQLWYVLLVFLAIAGSFVWAVIHDEMHKMMNTPGCTTADILAQGYPADPSTPEPQVRHQPVALTRRESANATVLLLIAQVMQLGLLVTMVFAFFCLFGTLALPAEIVTSWIGHAPTGGSLLGWQLPVSDELIQASLFLAAFSAVSFAGSSVNDPIYRTRFFEPLLHNITVSITARKLYHPSQVPATEQETAVV